MKKAVGEISERGEKCPECGRTLDISDEVCPECGLPVYEDGDISELEDCMSDSDLLDPMFEDDEEDFYNSDAYEFSDEDNWEEERWEEYEAELDEDDEYDEDDEDEEYEDEEE